MKNTAKGFREVIHCGADVENIVITVYKKKKLFQKQKVDSQSWRKGSYPMRIILEDSPIWDKGRV